MAKKRSDSVESVPIKPTMGPAPDEFRLVLNMTPRMGRLERRPSLQAVNRGLLHNGSSPMTPDSTPGAASSTHLTWKILESGISDGNQIAEGIDIEYVNGQLFCTYLSTDMKFESSFHSPVDPMFGRKLKWTFFGAKEQAPKVPNTIRAYHLASYWKKRISTVFDSFIVTGHGTSAGKYFGFSQLGYTTGDAGGWGDAENQFLTTFGVRQSDMLMWNADPLKLMAQPSLFKDSEFIKNDPYATIYCTHRPRDAFVHVDRLGQAIWYGFSPQRYDVDDAVPVESVLLAIVPDYKFKDSSDGIGRAVDMQPYDVWYSEAANPMVLPLAGLTPMNTGSQRPEVVGMAEYSGGTAVFTKDSIQFMQGVGTSLSAGGFSRRVLHKGTGCDSRWSIKPVGPAVAFVNRDGLHVLTPEQQVLRVPSFDELFGDGVELTRDPGTDLNPGSRAVGGPHATATDDYNDASPFIRYRVDKSRLDRAVAFVWDDLYICALSNESHGAGDDNRLCLVWNWRENTSSIWMLPKHLGIRGVAYEDNLAVPYVMTRYGIARFGERHDGDTNFYWDTSGNEGIPAINTGPPVVCVAAQTHMVPSSGDSFVNANALIDHTVQDHSGKHDDYKLRVQMWTDVADLAMGYKTPEISSVSNTDSGHFDGIFKGDFNAWRQRVDGGIPAGESHNRENAAGNNPNTSRRVGTIRKTSIARNHANALRHRVQFYTYSAVDIYTTQLLLRAVAPRGTRS